MLYFTAMTLRGNHIYDHLGVRSHRLDDASGETRMPVNDDRAVDHRRRNLTVRSSISWQCGVTHTVRTALQSRSKSEGTTRPR